MRIVVSFATLLLLIPAYATASPIVRVEFLNSELTFGLVNPDQSGRDLDLLSVSFISVPHVDSYASSLYEALSGPLVQQTLVKDGLGSVIESEYLYEGGSFQADFAWLDGGGFKTGSFVAPIVSLHIVAGEGASGHVEARYLLGPGLFDDSIAKALGIGRRTVGGDIESGLVLVDDGPRGGIGGDHTTRERQAWDGYAEVTLVVPEPPMAILGILGLSAFCFLRRRTCRP